MNIADRIKALIQNVVEKTIAAPIRKEKEKIREEMKIQQFIETHPETKKEKELKKLKERTWNEAEKWGISKSQYEKMIVGVVTVGESPQWLSDYFEGKREIINRYTLDPGQQFDEDFRKIKGQRVRRF